MDIYTHFTSPIRRYADVLVHRLLASAIGAAPVSLAYNKATVAKICDNMNMRHTMAQHAGRASAELHTVLLFRGKTFIETGHVTSLKKNGFLTFIPKFAIESVVYVCAIDDPHAFTLDEKAQTLTSKDGSISIRVLDKVTIHISVDDENPHEQRLVLRCIDPKISEIPSQTASPSKRSLTKPATTPKKPKK
jgi:exosome complex exonuclease DIS3/RRP44